MQTQKLKTIKHWKEDRWPEAGEIKPLNKKMMAKVETAIKKNLGYQELMLTGIEHCIFAIKRYEGPWTKEALLQLINKAEQGIKDTYEEEHKNYRIQGVGRGLGIER